MTSTADAAGHPDVEELSDLTEGILPPSRTTDVRQHLDGCALCSDVYASLEEIRSMLGTLPGASHLPNDIAERIDAALAAEALLESTGTGAPAVVHVSRETSSSPPTTHPAGHPRTGTGPGRTGTPRRRRRTVVLGTVVTAAVLGLGTLLTQALDDGRDKNPASARHTDAAHTYSDGTLHDQVTTLLTMKGNDSRSKSAHSQGSKSDAGTSSGSTGKEPNSTLRDSTVDVPTCIERAIDGSQVVLAVDKGVYKGNRVYLVVTPDASDSTKVAAYLVDASCTNQTASSSSGSSGKVLLTRTYARS